MLTLFSLAVRIELWRYKVTGLFVLQACSTVNVGSSVWVEDPEVAWIDGEVIEVKGNDIKVLCTSGKTVCLTSLKFYVYVYGD